MRYFTYEEPETGRVVVSESDIVNRFYAFWVEKMIRKNKVDDITRENCILDWCREHSGREIDKDGKSIA